MRIHTFMHVPFEGLGYIEDWVNEHNYDFSFTQWYKKEHPPALDDWDVLFVLGGPMGVYDVDKHPWLLEEKAYIKAALEKGKPILGICLGSQILAELLGATVKPNPEAEIGWHKIAVTESFQKSAYGSVFEGSNPWVFQWHGDGFELPDGAEPIANSPVTPCQGFVYKNQVLALQFHLEMNEEYIKRLIEKARDQLDESQPHVQSEAEILERMHLSAGMKNSMFRLLNQWTSQLAL